MVDMPYNQTKLYISNRYMHKMDLALNNLQWLIYYITKPNYIYIYIYIYIFVCVCVCVRV